MENTAKENSIFYVHGFWNKIKQTYKILFTDWNLIALSLIPGLIIGFVLFVLIILGVGGFLISSKIGNIDVKALLIPSIIGIIVFVVASIVISIIGAIMIMLGLRKKELGQEIKLLDIFNESKNNLSKYINIIILVLKYLILEILIVIAGFICMIFSTIRGTLGSVLAVVSVVLLIRGFISLIIKGLDVAFIYNIAIVENKNPQESLEKSKLLIKGKKRDYLSFMIVFSIINSIIIGIVYNILGVNNNSSFDIVRVFVNSFIGFVTNIALYMFYRQYEIENSNLTDVTLDMNSSDNTTL